MAIRPAKIPFLIRRRANVISNCRGGGGGSNVAYHKSRQKRKRRNRRMAGDVGDESAEGVHCRGNFSQKEHTQILRPKGAFLQIPSPCLLSCVARPAPSPCQGNLGECAPCADFGHHQADDARGKSVPAQGTKTPHICAECRREGIVPPRLTAVQRTPLAAPNSLFSAVCARWRRAALHLLHAYVPAPIVGLGQWRRRRNLQSVVKVGIT